jgi:regulator of protease activity HflC (stomatin/prohibitin superfamily)
VGKKCFAAFLFMASVLFVSCSIVGPTERGVKVSMGKPQDGVLGPGVYGILPFLSVIEKYDLTPERIDVSFPVGQSGAISKDNQTIGFRAEVFYRYQETSIMDAVRDWSSKRRLNERITSDVGGAFKIVIGQYSIYDVAAQQGEITQKVKNAIIEKSTALPVEITQVNISNWDWPDSFDDQIQATMEMAQQARKAEQELKVVEQQSQKKVLEAEAELKKAKLLADAEIESARGKNEANRLIAQNLNVEVRLKELEIEKIKAEKFNGRLVPDVQYAPLPLDIRGN